MSTPMLRDDVLAFVADRTKRPRPQLTPQTTLMGDLGIDGADAQDLLMAYAKRFEVDMSAYNERRYFRSEGALLSSMIDWPRMALRWLGEMSSTPESRARRRPITIQNLVDSAIARKWVLGDEKPAPP